MECGGFAARSDWAKHRFRPIHFTDESFHLAAAREEILIAGRFHIHVYIPASVWTSSLLGA